MSNVTEVLALCDGALCDGDLAARNALADLLEEAGRQRSSRLVRCDQARVLNQIVEAMYPGGDPNAEWSPDTLDEIAYILDRAGLVPQELATPATGNLDRAQSEAAERAWLDHDFGDLTIKDSNGWEHVLGGSEWSRAFFEEAPNGGDSIRHVFVVRFEPGTAEVVEAYVSG
jgi:hypothetical protein